jgi:hypothetical protein
MAWELSGFEAVNDAPASCLVPVRVVPNARKELIVGWQADGRLRLKVAAVPEDGRANKAVEALLAETLGLHARCVSVEKGHSSREKLVRVNGLGLEDVKGKISTKA